MFRFCKCVLLSQIPERFDVMETIKKQVQQCSVLSHNDTILYCMVFVSITVLRLIPDIMHRIAQACQVDAVV